MKGQKKAERKVGKWERTVWELARECLKGRKKEEELQRKEEKRAEEKKAEKRVVD